MAVLSTEQMRQVRAALALRRKELIEEIRSELERSGSQHFSDLAGEVADVGDSSVADMLVDQDIAMVRRQVEELTAIEASQHRASSEDFGACEECGAEIGIKRLLAVPHATRCIACQGQHEKMFAHEATPKF